MANQKRGWHREYFQFLVRMAVKYPVDFLRHVFGWNVYVFAPGLSKRVRSSGVFSCDDVEHAVAAFRRDGFVVLSDALDPEEVAKLHRIVKDKADEIVSKDAEGLISPDTLHGPRRYSYGEYGHNAEWAYLGHNERVVPILNAIWQGHGYRAVAAGGDFVLPGGEWQLLHSDMGWKGAGEEMPRLLIVNFYVSTVSSKSGPIRMVPRTARFPVPPKRVISRREPRWMKESTATGEPGYAVIRDPRGWHGGTPNTSVAPRYMPNIEYALRDAAYDEIYSTASIDQLEAGRWIAEFPGAEPAAATGP